MIMTWKFKVCKKNNKMETICIFISKKYFQEKKKRVSKKRDNTEFMVLSENVKTL